MRIKLIKAFNHNGKEYKELNFEFDKLTGFDMVDAEEITRRAGGSVAALGAADYPRGYVLTIAAKASGLPREALMSLGAQDFTNILNQTLIFLSGVDSGNLEEETA